MIKYKKVATGIKAKIENGYAYVQVTYKKNTRAKELKDLAKPWNMFGNSEIDYIMSDKNNIADK